MGDMSVDTDVPYGYEPLRAYIVNLPEPQKIPRGKRVSSRTIVLTAANPSYQAAQVDPARIEMHIEPITNPVIMSHSISQANDASNTVSPFVNPNGRILSNLVGEYIVPGGENEIWFTTNTYPTLIGITIVREF